MGCYEVLLGGLAGECNLTGAEHCFSLRALFSFACLIECLFVKVKN